MKNRSRTRTGPPALLVPSIFVFVFVLLLLNAGPAAASALNDFNLIVLGNLSGTSEVEGRTVVFGNITGNAKNFATDSEAVADPVDTEGLNQSDGLIVGGQIQTTVQVNNGGVRVGGSSYSGTQVNNADYVTYNDDTVADLLTAIAQDVADFTTMLDGLAVDSTVNPVDRNYAQFICTPGDDDIAVFEIDAAFLTSGNYNFDLVGAEDVDLIVITITGSDAVTIGSNLHMAYEFLDEAYQAKIVWYLPDVTELTICTLLGGSVIAPNADLTLYSPVEGTVVANNVYLNAEIHLPSLDTPETPTNPVPEPGTMVLFGLGGLVLGVFRSRKKTAN